MLSVKGEFQTGRALPSTKIAGHDGQPVIITFLEALPELLRVRVLAEEIVHCSFVIGYGPAVPPTWRSLTPRVAANEQ